MDGIEGGGYSDEEAAEAEKFNAMVDEGKLTPAEASQIEKDKTPEEVEAESKIGEEVQKEVDEVLKKAEKNSSVLAIYFVNFDAYLPGGYRDIQFEKELEKDPNYDVRPRLEPIMRKNQEVSLRQFREDIEKAIDQSGLNSDQIRRLHGERYGEKSMKKSREISNEILRYIAPAFVKLRSWGYDQNTLRR